jgi:endonuclease YncB( thermonuclease family)
MSPSIVDDPFPRKGEQFCGRVIDVYDGDTFKCNIMINGEPRTFSVRMYGYDSTEMKQPRLAPNRLVLKAKAVEDRALFVHLLSRMHGELRLTVVDHDKYGRLLCMVSKYRPGDQTIDIPKVMIAEGHGVPYFGGTKGKSCEVDTTCE